MATRKKKLDYTYAVGRRKTANARVRFYTDASQEGKVTVNEQDVTEYFDAMAAKEAVAPIKLVAAPIGGYFTVKVTGGGKSAQAQAVRHGISRILIDMNEEWKPLLKQKGYLTRDSRMKERKKPGLRGARRAPQWSKR